MKIVRWNKCSFVDYPGHVAVTLYTAGCNFRCYYCHDRSYLVERTNGHRIPTEAVIEYLSKRENALLDSVVITGGEPTLQHSLLDFLTTVRSLNYSIKLDTNGSNPKYLGELLRRKLVDYIALDLKAPPEKLRHIVGVAFPFEKLEESRKLILESDIDYEFRTTVLPEFTREDILNIGRSIRGANRYVLQRFVKPKSFPQCQHPVLNRPLHPASFFLELRNEMRGWFNKLIVRDAEAIISQDLCPDCGIASLQTAVR